MCGIAGLFFPRADKAMLRSALDAMNRVHHRRGPDGSGVWCESAGGLGHTRLAIIDVSAAGAQPMQHPSGRYVITFNGEIYNYIELREELEALGHTFRTQSDTEVLLNAYVEWGVACFQRLLGMWAFAIVDTADQRLILSRDRFGIKPLYYAVRGTTLVFASTIQAIRASGEAPVTLNCQVARDYLLRQSVDETDETFLSGIKQFPAASYAVINLSSDASARRISPRKYWDVASLIAGEHFRGSLNEASSELKELLRNSIALHTRSDVEVGSCLSGGVDSSTIVSILAALPEGSDIRRTFSASFPGRIFDEARFAELVASRNRLELTQVFPNREDFLDEISTVIEAQGQPFGSTGIYVQWKVFEAIHRHHVKVVLDGQGADEYLGGYFSFYFPFALDALLSFHPIQAMSAVATYARENRYRHHVLRRLRGLAFRLFGFDIGMSNRGHEEIEPLISSQPDAGNCVDPRLAGIGFKKVLVRYLTAHSLPSLLRYEDMNSMWFSVESRVPYLDHRLVEFALRLPSNFLVRRGWTKMVLREAVCSDVPEEVVWRRDKIGFASPEGEWVRSLISTGRFHDLIASRGADAIVNRERAVNLIEHPGRMDPNYLWRLFNLLQWHSSLSAATSAQ